MARLGSIALVGPAITLVTMGLELTAVGLFW